MESRRLKENLISRLKEKSMLITATFLLISMFTNTSLARETEIPENLIEEKESKINEVMLAASATAPNVSITQKTGEVTVDWSNSANEESNQASIGWSMPGTYTWTAPEGVNQVKVVLAGAGGGGGGTIQGYEIKDDSEGSYYSPVYPTGGNGGRGNKVTYNKVSVTPGRTYTVVVGQGGTAGTNGSVNYMYDDSVNLVDPTSGKNGGASKFGTYSAQGGTGGTAATADKKWSMYLNCKNGTDGTSYGNGGKGGTGGTWKKIRYWDDGAYDQLEQQAPTAGTDGYVQIYWTEPETDNKYDVFQSKDGGTETKISGASGVIGTQYSTTVKETGKPTAPTVTATKSGTGNNIKVTASTDTGSTFTYRVEKRFDSDNNKINGEVIIMADMSESMKGYRSIFRSLDGPIATVAKDMISKNMRVSVGTLPKYSSENYLSDFITNVNDLPEAMGHIGSRTDASTEPGIYRALTKFANEGSSKNQNLIIFTDSDGTSGNQNGIYTRMKNGLVNLYVVYHAYSVASVYQTYANGVVTLPYRDNDIANAFEDIWAKMEEDMQDTTATKTVTATSGIKGYQYYISTSATPNTTTLGKQAIVALSQVPTFVSGEENAVQYLHIRAVDNAGNVSDVTTTKLEVPVKITLTSNYVRGQNYVPLSWTNNDNRAGWKYELYRKQEGEARYTNVTLDSSNTVKTLKSSTSKTESFTKPGTYTWTVPEGVTSINVTVAGAEGGAGGTVKTTTWLPWGGNGADITARFYHLRKCRNWRSKKRNNKSKSRNNI